MSGQRPDVSRLFEFCGLDPSEYLQVCDQVPRFASLLAASVATDALQDPRRRIRRDPALRSALLRARLLRDEPR